MSRFSTKGYVSKLQVLTSTDVTTEMGRLLAVAQNQIAQYHETAAALKAQRESYIHKWFSDTASQMVLDVNDLNLTKDGLDKAQKYQDLTSLNAPEDAIVVKIGKLSPGSVAPRSGFRCHYTRDRPSIHVGAPRRTRGS